MYLKKNIEDKYNSAFSEKEAIGFASYFFGYNGDCGRMLYLEDIYIKPAYRSKGYGTTVFKYMAKVVFNLIMLFYKIWKYLHSIFFFCINPSDRLVDMKRNDKFFEIKLITSFFLWIIFQSIFFSICFTSTITSLN